MKILIISSKSLIEWNYLDNSPHNADNSSSVWISDVCSVERLWLSIFFRYTAIGCFVINWKIYTSGISDQWITILVPFPRPLLCLWLRTCLWTRPLNNRLLLLNNKTLWMATIISQSALSINRLCTLLSLYSSRGLVEPVNVGVVCYNLFQNVMIYDIECLDILLI